MNPKARVLIVEDEILIADTLERYLVSKDYEVVGKAISYNEAIALFDRLNPDLALLDIRINSPKTGIDVAKYILKSETNIPFIYLTSQVDPKSLNEAKETFPAGYLPKPVQKTSLYTTLEIILHNYSLDKKNEPDSIILKENDKNFNVLLKDILFVNADHVYLGVYIKGGKKITIRNTLKWMLEQLPRDNFIHVHRSYVVNIDHVNKWSSNFLNVDEFEVPISRGKRKETIALLEAN